VISYRSVTASGSGGLLVDGLSFDAPSGVTTVVLATPAEARGLIATLANGVERATSGRVVVDGVDQASGPRVKRRRAMGWVRGPVQLFPHRTVAEQIRTSAALGGVRRRARALAVDAALSDAGISVLADRFPHQLDRSDRVRVALARALVHDPEVVILVDPFEGLESAERSVLRSLVLGLQRSRPRTMLMVTGDFEDALQLGDQVVVVANGRALQSDTPANLLASPYDDTVAAMLGEHRGFRRLHFATIDGIEADDRPIVHQTATGAAASFVARPTSPYVLVVNDDRRPLGWIDTTLLAPDRPVTDVPLLKLGDEVARSGDSLGAVLDRVLSSPTRMVARVNDDDRVLGVYSQGDLTEVMESGASPRMS
jgi:ABC-type proline/glycine betaine transport system ATPase subunit